VYEVYPRFAYPNQQVTGSSDQSHWATSYSPVRPRSYLGNEIIIPHAQPNATRLNRFFIGCSRSSCTVKVSPNTNLLQQMPSRRRRR
jgi:hypothetical protein